MKIAVSYDPADGQIFQHFGRTEYFKVYEIKDKKVSSSSVESTNGQGHGALAGVIKGLGAEILICGGIGAGAKEALASEGVSLYGGCSGSADEAVEAFLNDRLDYQEDICCEHHEEEHHEGGCGHHGDHGHSCGHGHG